MAAKMQERRSRQARRYERARRRALREAERRAREAAIAEASRERFVYPELRDFAAAVGVAADVAVPAAEAAAAARLAAGGGASGGGGRADTPSWLELFCAIADQVPYSIMLVDMNVSGLPLTFCNVAACRLTGYEREEMVGRNCRFMQGRRTQGAAVRAFAKAIREAAPATVVVTNFRKDGSEFSNLVALQPIFGEAGYLYSVAVQCENDEAAETQEWFHKLRAALPPRVSTLRDVHAARAAASADAAAVLSLIHI